jgi:hypothetical protein
LAGALSSVAPELQRYAIQSQDLQDQKALKTAEQKAAEDIEMLQEANLTFSEAVSQGLIQPHQNPITRARYRELLGRNLGERAMSDWFAFRQENLAGAISLEEYDESFNEFYGSWADENLGEDRQEPALATAFRQTVQQSLMNDRRAFSAQAGVQLINQSMEDFYSTVHQGVTNKLRSGEDVAAYISDETEAQIGLAGTSRGKRRRILQLAVEASLTAAERMALTSDDPMAALEIFEALQRIPMGSTSWAQDLIRQSESRVYSNIQAASNIENRQRSEALNDIVEEATALVFEQGALTDLAPYQQAINRLGIDQQAAQATIRSLEETRRSLAAAADRSEPQVRRDILTGIIANPGSVTSHIGRIEMALRDGTLSSGDAQNLYAQAKNYGSAAEDGAYSDGAYDRLSREFRALFGQSMDPFTPEALQREQSMSEYNKSWRDWLTANPDADVDEKETYLLRLSERLKARYNLFEFNDVPVPRDARLGPYPEWNQAPVMAPTTWATLEAAFNYDSPLERFPMEAQEAVFELFGRYSLNPTNPAHEALISELIEAQRAFFTEPTDRQPPGRER